MSDSFSYLKLVVLYCLPLLLILHGFNYNHILALFLDIAYPVGIPLRIALLCTSRF